LPLGITVPSGLCLHNRANTPQLNQLSSHTPLSH
jgi:hypothetical protein